MMLYDIFYADGTMESTSPLPKIALDGSRAHNVNHDGHEYFAFRGEWVRQGESGGLAAPLLHLLETFRVTQPNDAAQRDHDLICTACGDRVCTVEDSDTLALLARTARSHVCDGASDDE